jgi:hypothetical protein
MKLPDIGRCHLPRAFISHRRPHVHPEIPHGFAPKVESESPARSISTVVIEGGGASVSACGRIGPH